VPAGQSSQAVWSVLGWVPAKQEVHSVAPGLVETVPAGHGTQSEPLSKVPAGHSTQAVCAWLGKAPGPQSAQATLPALG